MSTTQTADLPESVEADLQQAADLIAAGEPAAAQQQLEEIREDLLPVAEKLQEELQPTDRQQELLEKLTGIADRLDRLETAVYQAQAAEELQELAEETSQEDAGDLPVPVLAPDPGTAVVNRLKQRGWW